MSLALQKIEKIEKMDDRKLFNFFMNLKKRIEKKQDDLTADLELLGYTKRKLESVFNHEIPTKETIDALKNSVTLPEYTSHEQLMRDVEMEIENEKN